VGIKEYYCPSLGRASQLAGLSPRWLQLISCLFPSIGFRSQFVACTTCIMRYVRAGAVAALASLPSSFATPVYKRQNDTQKPYSFDDVSLPHAGIQLTEH
jgi:hypothetical protein